MRYLLAIWLVLAAGCQSEPEAEPDRLPAGRHNGLLLLYLEGFDFYTDPHLRNSAREGTAEAYIHHPIDDAGAPEPSYLSIVLQVGLGQSVTLPEPAWGLGAFQIHIRQRDTTPRGTRTLFTADMEPPQLVLERVDPADETRLLRYEGVGELEVFAADLKTGATWGRVTGTLHPLDSTDGPHTFEAEFAAIAFLHCVWEVPPPSASSPERTYYQFLSGKPADRADECSSALAEIDAAEAHADAPPVPPFTPSFYGTFRPPERWSGLDRDL